METIIDRLDLQLVLAISEHHSLAVAARSMDLSPPAVTKRLAQLEKRLGAKLFQRSTRHVAMTDEGEAFCRHAKQLLGRFADMEAELSQRAAVPRGTIRLCSSFGFGRALVGPAVADFAMEYPGIEVQLHLTEHLPDLMAGGFDAAIWLWQPRQTHYVVKRLAPNQRILVCSPQYARRHPLPEAPEQLTAHPCLVTREHDEHFSVWRLSMSTRSRVAEVKVQGALSSNSGELVRDWALAGHGIALRSVWDVYPYLQSGRLVRVLAPYAVHNADVHWVAPHRHPVPQRIRLLRDFMQRRFSSPAWTPWLQEADARNPLR